MASASKVQDIARIYHINSRHLRSRVFDLRLDSDRHPLRFRTYPGSPRFELPGRDFDLKIALGEALKHRQSIRDFQLAPLALETLGRLLFASYGLRGLRQFEGQWTFDRPVPSAGGLYPLEIYVATQAVEGLADGIYHYDVQAHQLELRLAGLVHPQIADMTLGQFQIRDANLVILISAIFERTMWKYGQRGYRFVWLDAGHLGENLYLVAGALGLGPFAIGGFYDDELNHLLELIPNEEEVIYLIVIGQPKPTETEEDSRSK